MFRKPTYAELEQRVKRLEKESFERKQFEDDLRYQKVRLESLIEYSALAIVNLDESHNIISCNRDFEGLFDFIESDIIGKNLDELIAGQEQIEDALSYTRKTFMGKAIHGTGKRKRKGGELIHVDIVGVPVIIDGKLIGAYGIYRDISGRKRVEEALRESELSYRTLSENLPGLVYRVFARERNRMQFYNDMLEPMTGYKTEELNRGEVCSIESIILTEDLERVLTSVKEAVKKNTPFYVEYRILHKDGGIRYFSERGRPVFGEGGNPLFIDGTIFDITERKRAEEALLESEIFLRTIVENIPDMIFVKNAKDLRFVRFNKAGEELLGYSREELIGKNDYDFFPKEEADFFTKKDRDVLTSGKKLYIPEELIQTKDKGERILHTKKIPIFNEDGMSQYLLGISEDITERKQAEALILKSNALLTSVINQAPFAIHIIEGEFSNISVVIENAESARIMGEPVSGRTGIDADIPEMLNTRFFSIDGNQEIPLSRMPSPRALKGEIVTNEEFIFLHADGTQIMVEASASPIYDTNNQIMAVAVIFQDITERKKAEKESEKLRNQLTQSQKMEAVGTLAGGIAHDFNNILAVILGNTELAAFDVPDSNPAAKSLKAIHQASIRAKDMVQQLLSFSRKNDEKSSPFNMTSIIKESMKMLRSAVPTSVEFKQHISGDLCTVLGDATQINQIVMNLVTNAAHAMSEEGGLLEVTLENIILQEEKACFDWVLSPGPYVRLKVKDTGEGIDPTIIDRIFEPYFTTKEVGKGTGMGLSVAHGIVKRHGGGIRVESVIGKGTVFEIYFPALKKTAEEKKNPEGGMKGGSERVLFVDDEESLVSLNRQRLERLGYQVRSTTKPVEALEWFKADPDQFDVIITDMTMPRLTGDRLAAEVLKIRPHMSVIICTGYSERMSAEKAKALGVRKYIEKPIDLRNLASSLREALDEK